MFADRTANVSDYAVVPRLEGSCCPDSVPRQGLEKSGMKSIIHELKTDSQSCFVTERAPRADICLASM